MKLVLKKIARYLLVFALLIGGLLFARLIFAADFGTNAVNSGLAGSLNTGDPRVIAARVINIFLSFLGIIALVIIIWGGYTWMTANGEEDKVSQAKKILKNGVIGLLIIISSWAIATFLILQFAGNINPPSPNGCVDGTEIACGCTGTMYCNGGVWSGCLGNDPQACVNPPASCDSSVNPGCQPLDSICGSGYYCDNSCLCQNQGGPGSSCDTDISNQQCDPDNNRCSEYLVCNPESCLCEGPPVITAMSPVGGFCVSNLDKPCLRDNDCGGGDTCDLITPNGKVNNFITIFGKNFGEYSAGTSTVIFLGAGSPKDAVFPEVINPLCINSWYDDQIVVAVPSGVQTGPLKVVNKDSLFDTTNDTYGPVIADFTANNIDRPGLCHLNPNQGNLGSEVTYQGINLFSGEAYFGNYQNNVQGLESSFTNANGLSGTSTTPNIRAGDSGSFVEREIAGFPQKSNYLKFKKDWEAGSGPYIISFTPLEGTTGQYVTVKGSGFGGAKGNNKVYFSNGNNKTEASYSFPAICANSVWKDNQIIIKVPEGLINNDYQIEIALGSTTISTQNLNPNSFNFDDNLPLQTSLCKIDPERGPIDTPVTLWGEYFGTIGNNGTVRFYSNQDAQGTIIKENDANKIDTAVPAAAVTGPVKVIKNNEWGNELNFTVGECTKDEECNNQICCPVNTYKKGRCVADINECFIDVPNSVFEWSFSTNFDATTTPPFDSCLGLSQYLGTCYQGAPCPNSPGSCSSPSTSYPIVTGNCDRTCASTIGCGNACIYDSAIDKCKKGSCDLPMVVSLGNTTTQAFCNSEGKWEITTNASCPSGWTRGPGNTCTQGTCALCSSSFTCELVGASGVCVSEKLCSNKDAKCEEGQIATEPDECRVTMKPSCECCCRIGFDQQDCCAGLKCSGKCGSDIILAGGVGTCCNATGDCINPNCPAFGGIVNEIGGYCTHTFTSSATFKTPVNLNATVLVVGGGGAAGGGLFNVVYDAGGGGGQVIQNSLSIPANDANPGPNNSYPVVIGNGGFYIDSLTNSDGGNSSFLGVTAIGGKKAISLSIAGMSGSGKVGGVRNGFGSGGGGGDSENGFNAPSNEIGGDGGDGTYSNISGTSIAYGGGGAGMSFVRAGESGLGRENPGGGGSGATGLPGNEAKKGIVIIRYPSVPAASCPVGYASSTNTFGNCSGCGLIGTSTIEHDMACNCSGSTSKFCSISVQNPAGVCVDCAQAGNQEVCGDHSSSCCYDSKGTATTTDDLCRGLNGGTVVNKVKPLPPIVIEGSDYGSCAYFNCQAEPLDPLICASSTPLKIGFFNNVNTCIHDCPENIGNDPCSRFNNKKSECSAATGCCYDQKTDKCLSGNQIDPGVNGYCAYYNCEVPPANPYDCNFNATTTGIFTSTTTCESYCGNPPGGAGLDCVYPVATSTCNTSLCTFPGFSCLNATGTPVVYPNCGTCCCQVGLNPDSCNTLLTPTLHCQADRGSCTGSNRGLCCGCTKDSECGAISSTGCDSDGCCQARPNVVSTLPAANATNVCRNASIKITFNQNMDLTSFGNNILLLEERVYGNGVCPAGTFLTDNRTIEELFRPQNKNIFARLWDKISLSARRLFGRVNDQALATPPDVSKLYCSIPGMASAEEEGSHTNLIFTPSKILSPSAKYYFVVKGDEALDSQSGILSFAKIGMNERGLNNGDGTFTNSSLVKFNKKAYLNSYSFQFTTLSDQGVNSGICAIDRVVISPASYLFKTTVNDLNEQDASVGNSTFDTVADRDKVFTAGAYSSNNQLLHPISGYNWNWDWSISDTNIAEFLNFTTDIPNNRKLVAAKANITDGQTKVNATINMDAYNPSTGCGADCNAYFVGDDETKASDIYVFICNNPWPAVLANGEWFPWNDAAGNCSINPVNCQDFNYKFYYCRDAGAAGTLDDLPAIISAPVVSGQGSNLLCSSDRNPCNGEGTLCGNDSNGDGAKDGICYWNVLKESYFFREEILPGGEITNATSTGVSGEVKIDWQSPASGVGSYKIYYLKSGRGTMLSQEFSANEKCTPSGPNNNCTAIINKLVNDVPYVFKLTVISTNKTESALSNEKTAIPSDQTRPSKPSTPNVEISSSTVKFTWAANPVADKVIFYRLYRGVSSGLYGESFDSANKATSLTFDRNQFTPTLNYFALSAINASNHEGDKSNQVTVDLQ